MSTRILREDIDRVFEFGINVTTRTLHITGGIDYDTARQALRGLDILTSGYRPNDPITIYLCSDGGDVGAGMAIHDAISRCTCHVTVIATGECESIAVAILQAGDTRLATPETLLMVHDGAQDIGTINPNDIDAHKRLADMQRNQYYRILAKKSALKEDEWRQICESDFYMDVNLAHSYKLIDDIA